MAERGAVLVVDDDRQVGGHVAAVLRTHGYRCEVTHSLDEARALLRSNGIDVCLCDLHVGDESGLGLAAKIRESDPDVVVAMMGSSHDTSLAEQAVKAGAYDYLDKPFRNTELLITVANAFHRHQLEREATELRRELEATVAERTLELALSRQETIHRLARAIEFRDAHTGLHVERMATYCRMIALRLGLPPERCSLIRTASLLHDIGKLGVPDKILVKPGPLTVEERSEVEKHTTYGHRILRGSTSELVQLAAVIAVSHHERFDGAGYPWGLSGEEIPIEGRIAAVCDVFDALTTSRPYRARAFTHEEAVGLIRGERGKAFDPVVADTFLDALDEVTRI